MPRGLHQVALSISCLSPIDRRPDAFAVTKIASLIFRPERRFLALTSFQSQRRPSLSFGSSSLISLRRQSLSLSRARLRPPGNIHSPSRFRLTRSTRPRFAATSFEDFAIPYAPSGCYCVRVGNHLWLASGRRPIRRTTEVPGTVVAAVVGQSAGTRNPISGSQGSASSEADLSRNR